MQARVCGVFLASWSVAQHCWMHLDHWVTISKEFWNQYWLECCTITPRILAYFPEFSFGFLASLVMPGNLLKMVTWTSDFLNVTLGSMAFVCPRVLGLWFLDILQSLLTWCSGSRGTGCRQEGQFANWLWKAKILRDNVLLQILSYTWARWHCSWRTVKSLNK